MAGVLFDSQLLNDQCSLTQLFEQSPFSWCCELDRSRHTTLHLRLWAILVVALFAFVEDLSEMVFHIGVLDCAVNFSTRVSVSLVHMAMQ